MEDTAVEHGPVTPSFSGPLPFALRFAEFASEAEKEVVSHVFDDKLTVYPTSNWEDSVHTTD